MKMHIEMINLSRAIERRALMEDTLEKAGVTAQFHPAFDMKERPREELEEHCRTSGPWGVLHEVNMACTISHAQVWERFLASDADLCLAMEDDIFISPDLGAWLSDLSWWPDDADIVKLERWRGHKLRVLLEKKTRSHRGRTIKRILSRHVGAAGYILTRDAARQFLELRPFKLTVDNLLFNFNASPTARRMKVYQIDPALIEQGNEPRQQSQGRADRGRPKGLALLKQKIQRGYFELAYPLSTFAKALTGRAKLAKITFIADDTEEVADALIPHRTD